MKPHWKRATVGSIIVILLLACLFLWVLLRPVKPPTLSVKKFWDDYPGGAAMAILCVSNGGDCSFLLQNSGGPDPTFSPGSLSPSYVVERKSTNVWISERSSNALPLWYPVAPGQAVEFRVSLPADGQVRRVVVPFKYAPKNLPSARRGHQQAVTVPPRKRRSPFDGVQQIWMKLLTRLGLNSVPKLRSPELVANPKPGYPLTQADRQKLAPQPDLISPHRPFAERYGIGYSLGTNSAVNRK